MRRLLVLIMLLLVAAPAAGAAPRPLTKLPADEGFALAGDRVLFTQSIEHRVQLRVMSVAGGLARTIASFAIASNVRGVSLVATGDRAGALVSLTHKDGRIGTQLFAGGIDGGWAAVTQATHAWDGRSMPVSLQLDSGLTFTSSRVRTALTSRPSCATPRRVTCPTARAPRGSRGTWSPT
jgi:hypothetical protein